MSVPRYGMIGGNVSKFQGFKDFETLKLGKL